MKLEHSFTVPAPFDAVWASFDDLDGLVPCVPGASLTSAEGDEFAGTVKVKLGPISLTYNGTGRFLERDRDSGRVVVEAKGKDRRGNGTAGATVTAVVRADGESTTVTMETDLTVTGKPAQFGRGVIQDVSNALLAQFVDCFSAKLAAPAAGDAAGSTGGDGAAAPGAEGARTDVAPASAVPASAAASTDSDSTEDSAVQARSTGGSPGSAVSSASTGSSAALTGGSAAAPGAGSPVPAPRPPASRPSVPPAAPAPAELNLLGAVLPVLAQRAALPVAALALLLSVVALFRRRR